MRPAETGNMDQRLTFQSLTRAADGQGGSTGTWGGDVTVWGEMEALSGGSVFHAQSLKHRVTHRVRIYKGEVAGLNTEMRVVHEDGRIFQVHHHRNIKEKNWLEELLVEEGTPS